MTRMGIEMKKIGEYLVEKKKMIRSGEENLGAGGRGGKSNVVENGMNRCIEPYIRSFLAEKQCLNYLYT